MCLIYVVMGILALWIYESPGSFASIAALCIATVIAYKHSMRADRAKRESNFIRECKTLLHQIHAAKCDHYISQFLERHRYCQTWPSHELKLLSELLTTNDVAADVDVLTAVLRTEQERLSYNDFYSCIESPHPHSFQAAVGIFVSTYGDQCDNYMANFVQYTSERWPDEYGTTKDIPAYVADVAHRNTLEKFAVELTSNEPRGISSADIDKMSGYEFERFLAHLYESMGYEVEQTPLSHDQGADLVICRLGERTVVQAKRFSGTVSNKAIQEVVAARAYYEATHAIVVTNATFSASALKLAKANRVELIDRQDLENYIKKYFP